MYHRKLQASFPAIRSFNCRIASALFSLATILTVSAATAEDLRCGTSTIRLICEHRAAEDNRCDQSRAEFRLSSGDTRIVRTPKGLDASQIPVAADCERGDGGDYVFIEFSNGGGGSGSSIDLFKVDGVALTSKGRNLDSTVKKMHITPFSPRRNIEIE